MSKDTDALREALRREIDQLIRDGKGDCIKCKLARQELARLEYMAEQKKKRMEAK